MIQNQKGFTLIEIILVVSLLAVTVGLTSDILLSLVRSNTKTQVINEIEQQSNFISLKLEKELRDARNVTLPEENSTGNTLTFIRKDGTEISYTLNSNNVITRNIGTETPQILTSNSNPGGVSVTCPSGCFNISGPNPQIVNISMEFKQAQGVVVSYSGAVKINSSVVIRNTY